LKKNINSNKGQGALEYLLIIGGVLVIAVVVISLIMSTGRSNTDKVNESEQQHSQLIDSTIIPPMILKVNCLDQGGNDTNIIVTYNRSTTNGVAEYCLVLNESITTNCKPPATTGNVVFFDNISGLATGVKHKVSLVAKRGDYMSQPALPTPTCEVE
jgi:uncharacterized protein (UPF0333 family)